MLEGLSGRNLYLDSNVVILAVEQGNPWSEVLLQLFKAIDTAALRAFTSELTLAEVLVKPIALAAADLIEEYKTLLAPDSAIKVVPISRTILNYAAEIRATMEVKLIDAIHPATARISACDLFVTNDFELGKKAAGAIRWLSLATIAEQQ